MTRSLRIGSRTLAVVILLGAGAPTREATVVDAAGVVAPMFEVDPMWPKPLPNHWVLGWTVGVAVDGQDHVWVVHRPSSLAPGELFGVTNEASCCFPAPPVLEFDQGGNLVGTGAVQVPATTGQSRCTGSRPTAGGISSAIA